MSLNCTIIRFFVVVWTWEYVHKPVIIYTFIYSSRMFVLLRDKTAIEGPVVPENIFQCPTSEAGDISTVIFL